MLNIHAIMMMPSSLLGVLVGKNDRDTLHEMMTQVCTPVIRQSTVEDGVPGK